MVSVRICVAYDIDGARYTHLPADQSLLEKAVPVYEDFPGWECDTTEARTVDELPENAQRYVRALARTSQIPITMLGIGPSRDEMIDVPATWLEATADSRSVRS